MIIDAGIPSFYTLAEAAEAAGCDIFPRESGDDIITQTFRVDSREVRAGDGFIAMQGAHTDGHNFIRNAVDSGASVIILEADRFETRADELSSLHVKYLIARRGSTSEQAAVSLASDWLKRVAPRTIGITGSVGKTTTREITVNLLNGCFNVHSAPKSYNTLIGCSMTILSMKRDTDVLVLEFGTNHPGEISSMVERFPVETAIITEVCPAHLEGLGSIEGVLKAKLEITESRRLKYLSYNYDNVLLREAIIVSPIVCEMVGAGGDGADIVISDVRQQIDGAPHPTLTFALSSKSLGHIDVRAPMYGRHNAMNIALAYSAASSVGADVRDMSGALAKAALPKGRCGISAAARGVIVLDDTYNANPASMRQALINASEIDLRDGAKRIAVLGGMRELGRASAEMHRQVLEHTSAFDELYLIGREWLDAGADVRATLLPDSASFAAHYRSDIPRGSVVLVKGSRYYALEHVLGLFDVGGAEA